MAEDVLNNILKDTTSEYIKEKRGFIEILVTISASVIGIIVAFSPNKPECLEIISLFCFVFVIILGIIYLYIQMTSKNSSLTLFAMEGILKQMQGEYNEKFVAQKIKEVMSPLKGKTYSEMMNYFYIKHNEKLFLASLFFFVVGFVFLVLGFLI